MVEALIIGGALFAIFSAVLSAFIFLLETVPYLAIAVLLVSIIGIFYSVNRAVKIQLKEEARRYELDRNPFFFYVFTNLTVLIVIYITVGIIGSTISPNIGGGANGISINGGNAYILKEIDKKMK